MGSSIASVVYVQCMWHRRGEEPAAGNTARSEHNIISAWIPGTCTDEQKWVDMHDIRTS